MNEDKATRYHRLRRRAVLLAAGWRMLFLVLLLVSGAAHHLRDASDAAVQALPGPLQSPSAAFVFAAMAGLAHGLGALPAAFFGGFILDRRYGLSRQPAALWLREHAAASVVDVVGVSLAAAWIYGSMAAAAACWWIPAWIGLMAARVAAAWAAPVALLPLFLRFVPLTDEILRGRLLALAAKAGVPALGVYEWRAGDRTSRANAALAGLGRTRRIILSDTLRRDYSPDEVEVILAHEVAHHISQDLWRGLAVDAAVGLLALLAADAALWVAAGPAGLGGPGDLAGMPVVGLAALSVWWLASPLLNAVSRAHERRADRIALELTQQADAFVSAMRRLAARNLAEESPALSTRLFFHTHPPIGERIAFARAWAASRDARGRPDGEA